MVSLAEDTCSSTTFSARFLSFDDLLCEENGRCVDYKVVFDENGKRQVINYSNHVSYYEKKYLQDQSGKQEEISISQIIEEEEENENAKKEKEMRIMSSDESSSQENNFSVGSPPPPSPLKLLTDTAKEYATPDGYLILLIVADPVQETTLEFLSSYLCRLESVFQSSAQLPLLILSDDAQTLSRLNFKSFAVISSKICIFHNFEEIHSRITAHERLEICRLYIIQELVKIGIHPIMNDLDTIWLDNPFPDLLPEQRESWSLRNKVNEPETFSTLAAQSLQSLSFVNNDGSLYTSGSDLLRQQRVGNPNQKEKISSNDDFSSHSYSFSKSVAPYDLAVMVDRDNILPNFIVFQPTERTLQFLDVLSGSLYSTLDARVEEFLKQESSQSEKKQIPFNFLFQKLLNYLFSDERETGIRIRKLPFQEFSTGFHYFLERKTAETAKIVVNNYLSPDDYPAKFYRLVKYDLWSFYPIQSSEKKTNSLRPFADYDVKYCSEIKSPSKHFHNNWEIHFSSTSKFSNVSSFTIFHPLHNQMFEDENSSLFAMTMLEGNIHLNHARDPRSLIHTYVNSDPLYGYYKSVFYSFPVSKQNHSLVSPVFLVPKTRLHHSVDVLLRFRNDSNLTGFGVDYFNNNIQLANEQMFLFTELAINERNLDSKTKMKNDIAVTATNVPFPFIHSDIFLNTLPFSEETLSNTKNEGSNVSYCIKVIAYNRVDSLKRLLNSLVRADYGGREDISLEILIDRYRSEEVSFALNQTHLRENKLLLLFIGKSGGSESAETRRGISLAIWREEVKFI
jgi:hypothetical protein